MSDRRLLLDLPNDDLADWLARQGEKPFRVKQIAQWLHTRRVDSFEAMTNLSSNLRARLDAEFALRVLSPLDHKVSSDRLTEKWLWQAPETSDRPTAWVEAVLIREQHLTRRTVCVSCMSGCPLGCVFCATGQGGFERNLTRGEILEQIYRVDASCRETEGISDDRAVSHVVFMGMGEPLLNYDEVLAATRALTDPGGLHLSGRHVTISTIGIPEALRRLAAEQTNLRLAWSLHAPDQALREKLIPAARRYPLEETLAAIHVFAQSASRDLTVEYSLIRDTNDHLDQAHALADLLVDLPCKVNLIPLNPTASYAGRPPAPAQVRAFQTELEQLGVPVTVRVEKGADIDAACGQLRLRERARGQE